MTLTPPPLSRHLLPLLPPPLLLPPPPPLLLRLLLLYHLLLNHVPDTGYEYPIGYNRAAGTFFSLVQCVCRVCSSVLLAVTSLRTLSFSSVLLLALPAVL